MTRDERRAMLRAAVVLVLVGTLRVGLRGPVAEVPEGASDLTALLEESEEAGRDRARRSKALSAGETIDPNRAESAELDRLPGVGPALADAIVRHRERNGGFENAADLLGVPGIGPASLERIRVHLDFSGGVPRSRRARPDRGPEDRVAVNRATARELTVLQGIGPALAARIVALRKTAGPFETPEALLEVPGIGPRTLERIRDRIDVGR